MNKVILIGNLGKDPELAFTKTQQAILKFSIATNESWTNKAGERQEKTEWHRIVLWGKRAEALSKILHKGSQVCVEGRIETQEYQDKQGVTKYSTQINASNIELLGKREGQRDSLEEKAGAPYQASKPYEPHDEDIPF